MLRFTQVDVFTDRLFEGNQLAVFPEARTLTDRQMQQIAREMNLAETAFVTPAERGDCDVRVRIFTPVYEMLFAGHPTIGTAFVLARLGRFPRGAQRVVFEERVGPVPVRLEGPPNAPSRAWLTTPPVTFDAALEDRAACAALAGLTESDLRADVPVLAAGAGPRFLYVPVRDRDTVDRAAPDVAAIDRRITAQGLVGIFVFAVESADRGALYSRMFAPGAGVFEDPATGSATGPLAAYVLRHRLVAAPHTGIVDLVSEQGTKMQRRSLLHMRVELRDGQSQCIEVGGGCVHVFDGELALE
ncbi:PhzF family phenazine biosynthesis protein [bacterium]|nr:MAG: PhzF family phenazine biosynthesis protein [bacterium]